MRAAKKTGVDRKILQELVPLNALSPERFKEISDKILIEEVKSGRYLFRKGDRDNQSIYLLEGQIKLLDGFRKVASEIESGTDISRYPISNMQPRTVSARAARKSVIARIDSSLLDAFLNWDQENTAEAVEIGADENSDWLTRMLQSEAFLKIPPSTIQSLLMKMQSVEVHAGDTIIQQGDEGDYFYTIQKGRCVVTRRDESGAEQRLAELSEGDSFGEEALVSDANRNAAVSMLTDGVLMRLAKDDFIALLQEPLVKRINYKTAAAMVEAGAVWVDVRTPDEYEVGSFEDSVNIPLATLRGEIPELVFNAQYVMCCDTGRRSGSAAFLLSHRGLDVYVLDGGIAGLEAGALYQTGPSDQPSAIAGEDLIETEELVEEAIEYEDVLQASEDSTADDAVPELADGPAGDEADSPAANDTVTADLEAAVETLRSRNEALGTELEQYRSTEARMTEQLELLRAELGESSEKLADLYSRAGADADEKEQLREAQARLQENHERQLQTVQSALDEARQQLGNLQSQTGAASDQQQKLLDEARAGQQASQEEIVQLQEDLAEARSQVQTTGEKLAAAGTASETLQAEHAAVLQEQHERIAGLQDALERAEQERAQLRHQLSASSEAIEVSESSLRAELQERIALSDRLEAELATLQQQSQEAAGNLVASTDRLTALETHSTELEARVESLQQELEEQAVAAEAERQTLVRRIEELDSESRQGSEQLSEVSTEREAAALKIQSLEQALEELTSEQQKTIAQLQEQTVRAEALETGQQAAEQALEQEQAERESERARHSDEAGELRQTIEELQNVQAERDDWQQRSSAQAEENSQLQQELASLQEQIATHTESAGEQQQALQSALEASQQRNTELEQAVTDRDIQLAGLQEALAGRETVIQERDQQLEGLRQELVEHEDRARVAEQESQESIRKAHEDLTRKNDNEKELQGQIGRLRKKLEQATLEQQQVREAAQADVDTIREELHAERQARAEERAEMGARQRELKEQLTAVASEHESSLNSRSGAIEEARDAAREEERLRLQELLQNQQQTEAQLQNLQQELQQAHAEIARQHQQEKERRQAEADLLQEQNNRVEEATAQLESRLKQLTEERDQSLEEQQALREKLNTLRGEVEVARGLMSAGQEGRIEDAAQLRSELEEARKNSEISVRLRAEAESARDQLIRERDTLREQLESRQDAGQPLHVPALDEDETGASHAGPPQGDTLQLSSAHADGIAGESADGIPGAPHEAEPERARSWFGRMAVGAVVVIAALVSWQMLDLKDSGQHSGGTSNVAVDEPALQDTEPSSAVASPEPLVEAPLPEAAIAVEPPARADQPPPVAEQVVTEPKPQQVIQKPDVPEPAVAAVPALSAGPVFRDKLKNGGRGPLMVELPDASYMMGSPGHSLNFDEGPRHRVTLEGFSIGKHEVSFAEYDRFARATGRRLPHDERWGRGDRPVINVSWNDANAYTAWLSKQTGKKYRLPTESEWEFAIRGGSEDQRWWGSESDTAPANCFNCGSRWDGSRTAPVGSFVANAFGLHDMAGNVQEWVQDCYHAGYAGAPDDGSAWLTPGCTQRVVRGGAYSSPQDTLRSAKRGQYDQDTRLDNLGFRVVRVN